MTTPPPKFENGREICGCYFGSADGGILPGYCRRPCAPGHMCHYCDDAMFHRHCVACGAVLNGLNFEPVELRCQACESTEL